MASTQEMGIDPSRRNIKPRPLSDSERAKLEEFLDSVHYSARFVLAAVRRVEFPPDGGYRYQDHEYEYRHVQLPKPMLKAIPKAYMDDSKGTLKLLWEDEWRSMGITQVRPPGQLLSISTGS